MCLDNHAVQDVALSWQCGRHLYVVSIKFVADTDISSTKEEAD